jgi:DNA-binding CsgD family transcriptional regulator
MPPRRDPIALVEACYNLADDEQAWLRRIAEVSVGILPDSPHGVVVYHVALTADGVRIPHAVQVGGTADVAARLRNMGALLDRWHAGKASLIERGVGGLYQKVVLAGLRAPADRLLMTEFDKVGPDWMYTLGVPGVRDLFFMANHHIDGLGATVIVGGLPQKGGLRPAERQMYQMLSAHIKAGQRLRRRLGPVTGSVNVPEDGAVLDAEARLVDAQGEARGAGAREELVRMARAIDGARAERSGRNEEALEVWQGLVDGRWSLVERFDADGRRFMLAHRNPENVVDPRGLTSTESRVTGLAVRGYANKLIAYHLGISEGTVTSHLHNALRKLGLSSRVELLRTLGTHYPQPTDPRFCD